MALEDKIMRIWNTCKRRRDIKLWLPILEFKRNILQSFDSGGKIGSLMRNNLENTHWAQGIRGVRFVCTENRAVLRLPEFSFFCSANHPRNPRGGHCFAESISSQETEDAACSSSLPRGSLQHTVCSGIKSETQLVFCFHCFLSLLLAVEPSILTVSGEMWLAGSGASYLGLCFCMIWAPHRDLKREMNILGSRKVTMPWTGRKQDSEASLWH